MNPFPSSGVDPCYRAASKSKPFVDQPYKMHAFTLTPTKVKVERPIDYDSIRLQKCSQLFSRFGCVLRIFLMNYSSVAILTHYCVDFYFV
jgi:hypothetical protein